MPVSSAIRTDDDDDNELSWKKFEGGLCLDHILLQKRDCDVQARSHQGYWVVLSVSCVGVITCPLISCPFYICFQGEVQRRSVRNLPYPFCYS